MEHRAALGRKRDGSASQAGGLAVLLRQRLPIHEFEVLKLVRSFATRGECRIARGDPLRDRGRERSNYIITQIDGGLGLRGARKARLVGSEPHKR